MKEILTEWRKYLVKEKAALKLVPKIGSAAASGGSFIDFTDLLSTNTDKEPGLLEKAADKLRQPLIDAFKQIPGVDSERAIDLATEFESAFVAIPEIVGLGLQTNPKGFSILLNFIQKIASSGPLMRKLAGLLGRGAPPIAIGVAILDVLSMAKAWNELTKVAKATKNMRAFSELRAIEQKIKKGEYTKPSTAIEKMELFSLLSNAKQVNPEALSFFPTVVQQLEPRFQKMLMKK